MTKRDIQNQVELSKKQLDFLRVYEKEMRETFGRRGYEDRINLALDNYIRFSELLKNWKDED
jgi:hypothetical protein